MLFAEGNGSWAPVPAWAQFLIRLGYASLAESEGDRRISIVSMPCDSAGAGLVALGALRYRLSLKEGSDLQSHFHRLMALAAAGGDTIVRHLATRKRYRLLRPRGDETVWAEQEIPAGRTGWDRNGPPRVRILPENSDGWYLDGEAPVQTPAGNEVPYGALYSAVLPDTPEVMPPNLRRSDSVICLAGRAAGETASQAAVTAARFRLNDQKVDLSRLLTIHSWSPGTVSRAVFFNPRTGHCDRNAARSRLVVADGDATLLKVIDKFSDSDVVGVVHRSVERDRADAMGVKIAGLRQWYSSDTQFAERLGPQPRGIAVLALRRA